MIEYEGIELIPIEAEDIDLLNKWKNDEDVFKFLGGGFNPISKTTQKNWVEKMTDNTGNNKRFIILNEQKNKIGFIGLYDISDIHRTCSLGIYIGEKDQWGKGIASRAYLALENYAKKYLNIRKIKLEVVKENEGAIQMYKKLQFIECGEYIEDRYIDGRYMNVMLMEKFI